MLSGFARAVSLSIQERRTGFKAKLRLLELSDDAIKSAAVVNRTGGSDILEHFVDLRSDLL